MRVCDSVTLASGATIPVISGQVGVVDEVSQNGYRYLTDHWDRVLSDSVVLNQIKERRMLGTIEHPTDDNEFMATSYENASHVVMKAWVQNHQPFASFGLVNNEKGNNIKALVDLGVPVGVSTRGMGNFGQDQISQYVDPEGYLLLTWDLVKSPNFAELSMSPVTDSLMATPKFRELVDMHQLKDSAFKGYNQQALQKDRVNAVTELKAQMFDEFVNKLNSL